MGMKKNRTVIATEELNTIALLGALSLFFAVLEYIIPKPVPFMKVGLANLPLIIGTRILPFPSFLLLMLLKVLGQGIVNGSLFSYVILFSVLGSLASGLTMYLLGKISSRWISLIGVSIGGALSSNLVQLFIAGRIVFGDNSLLLAPPFILTGIISSIILGFFALNFYNKSKWIRKIEESRMVSSTPIKEEEGL